MQGEEGPPSLEYIQAKDLFPPKELVKEEEYLQVPFSVLQGEGVEYLGHANDAVIAVSNYRLHIKLKDSVINVPLRMMESVESRDMFQLHIICKDSKVVRCHFSTFKQCQEWLKRLSRAIARPAKPEDLFAFAYHAWCLGVCADEEDQHAHLCHPGDHVKYRFEMEVVRMDFDLQNVWRVSDINSNYKLCTSYPQKLLVPVWITDKELENVASFRSWKRIPVVVYRHQPNGAAIARCSQPEISWWGWRNADDEYLVTSIAKACALNPGTKTASGTLHNGPSEGTEASDTDFDSSLTACSGVENAGAPQKLLILDARSYTAAVANRAKGGGCECEEYYPNCEVVFMGMANIHSIRNSFQYLRAVCSQMPDPSNWLSALESTKWLQHLSVMLKTAVLVSNAVDREGRPVLVHCSDGWDRTPQIVALAKILLDPYYRTMEGFQVLVESDWLDFGHKFGDRCGHHENVEDQNEQCPVFLQWLDSVHQLLKQFPCLFEFNEAFLVLHPVCHVRALHLWTAVYLPASSPCPLGEEGMDCYLPPGSQSQEFSGRSLDRLPKTRSMDDLLSAGDSSSPLTRTSSDPNLNNHCQEVRMGLEPRHASTEGPELHPEEGSVVAVGETLHVPVEQGKTHPLQTSNNFNSHTDHQAHCKPLSGWVPPPASNNFPETEMGWRVNVEDVDGISPAPNHSGQENVCRTCVRAVEQLETCPHNPSKATGLESDGSWNLVKPPHQDTLNPAVGIPSQDTPALSVSPQNNPSPMPGIPHQYKDTGKSGSNRSGHWEEMGRVGMVPLKLWQRPISQSQTSEFSLLGSNWDSFQGMVTSLPGGETVTRRLLSYGCCNKRLSSKQLRAPGLYLTNNKGGRGGREREREMSYF
uniref:Myotubularin related protein 4 n=1 Tax=Chelonoidis abingdonii TaxID=106734 RepID=A0A8C0IPD2_CHEAB